MCNILDVDIDYIEELPEEYKVSVYLSNGIGDLKGGWYSVRGKIWYDDEHFDYYVIRVYRKKLAREYYRRILNKRGYYER